MSTVGVMEITPTVGMSTVGVMSHTTTEEKSGMDFSPSSGEATSGEKNFPMSHEWRSHE